ncbi:response regulator [Oligoflexus sp.]|uniref:response regulator n=1 Tax=Oligoflexus sp. TaxID=1971216 RepID=UPI002D7910CB|nr:response regulator [Oligoflexus sp.]
MINLFARPADMCVHVVEPMVALRSVLIETLRNQGFSQVTGFGDFKTLLVHLSTQRSDWIVAGGCFNSDINIIHLLKLCLDEPRLQQTRVSFMMREHEKEMLPLAFELGLLSYHSSHIPSRIPEEISDLLRIIRLAGYRSALASSNFLCRILKEERRWDMIIHLQKSLLDVFPGSSQILLALAEAELNSGRKEGRKTLEQVLLIDPSLTNEVEQLKTRFVPQETLEMPIDLDLPLDEDNSRMNVLGLASCILIDPDTTVHQLVRQSLKTAGVEQVETFESGDSAWRWLTQGGRPSLILMEWRIPELNALQLIQRINQHSPGVPIILISSLINPGEFSLIKEIGVRGVVEKPFDTQTLMTEIITVIQQHRYPSDQTAMDRRIQQCLATANEAEASRLIAMYLCNPAFEPVGKLRIEAEFAFFKGRYKQCCTMAFEALKITGDSLDLLNLLAKALMRLGDYENALKLLEKANALAPRNIDRICRMATICSEMGKEEEAESLLVEAKTIDAVNILVSETEAHIAIASNDTKRAAETLKGMENLHRIVAYTNNKAVALIRNNQLQKGINLYKSALESLPQPWNDIHDTICFNLGLAYIRLIKYQEAKDIFGRIKADGSSATARKVTALIAKLDHAVRTQTQLQFATETSHDSSAQSEDTMVFNLEKMMDSLIPVRGDICCYRIFRAQELASESMLKMLQNMPKMAQRPPLRKVESQVKSDRSQAS